LIAKDEALNDVFTLIELNENALRKQGILY